MTVHGSSTSLAGKLLLCVLSLAAVLVVVEAGYFSWRTARARWGPGPGINRFDWCGECPEIYRNKPHAAETDALGFRICPGYEDARPDAAGSGLTILILGDSVAYGYGVACEATFPHLLGGFLNEAPAAGGVRPFCTVINAGVPGYGTYNELQLYREAGRLAAPGLVVLALVLNDVANPRLHWAERGVRTVVIPPAALPNPAYDENHAKPVLARWRRQQFWRRFLVGKAFHRLHGLIASGRGHQAAEETWPVNLVGEDDLAITVLTDPSSPESRWLKGLLALLRDEVTADGARFAIMVVPLSYQLDPAYPHEPQRNIRTMCQGLDVPCLDLLPVFREHRDAPLYLGDLGWEEDVWHLAPAGHRLAALSLREFLENADLTPGGTDHPTH